MKTEAATEVGKALAQALEASFVVRFPTLCALGSVYITIRHSQIKQLTYDCGSSLTPINLAVVV
jgi:hypothetical protein